jgi:succinoglycan biosynthesis transport protein ExoP
MSEQYQNGVENGNGNGHLEEQREVSLRDLLAVVFRRKGIIVGVVLAAVATVVLLNLTSPVQYLSTATIRVNRGEPESAFNSRLRTLTWEEELNSEIQTITSQQVLQLAQENLDQSGRTDSKGLPIHIDPGAVSATVPGKSSVLMVSCAHGDKKAAQESCRAVTQAYADFRLRVRSVPEVEEFFRQQIESLREQLDEWEQERAAFMNEESVVRIADERVNLLSIRQQSEVDLNRVRAELAELQAKVEILHRRQILEGDKLDLYAFTDGQSNDHDVLFRLRTELVQERAALYEAESQYTDAHPRVQALRTQVSLIENDLRSEMDRYIRHMESRVEVARAREEALLKTIRYGDAELAALPDKEARLASYDRVLDQLKANYDALVDKQIQARIEKTGTSDWNMLILQPATPGQPVRVNDYVRMALIPILSLLVGLALAFVIDGLDHTIKDASEVENHLRLPVLGSVGRIR